jgi:hypothetical protein
MTTETSAMQRMPFKYRLRAWWEGYDLAELARLLARQPAAAGDDDDTTLPRAHPPLAAARATPAAANANSQGWTPALIAAGQIVFGEHSLSPRGDCGWAWPAQPHPAHRRRAWRRRRCARARARLQGCLRRDAAGAGRSGCQSRHAADAV